MWNGCLALFIACMSQTKQNYSLKFELSRIAVYYKGCVGRIDVHLLHSPPQFSSQLNFPVRTVLHYSYRVQVYRDRHYYSMSKKIRRMEAKKRKAEAFLQIAKLNDEDRIAKKVETEAKRPKPDQQTPPRLTSKPLLSGESYEELRAKLRERKKLLKSLPDFGLKTGGENASVEIPANLRTPLFAADVQRLLMYLMVGDKMPWATTKWCRVDKWNKFANVVCVVAENCGFTGEELLTARDVEGPARRLDGLLKHKLAVVSPASYDSTFAQDLMMVAASNKRKRMLESAYGSLSDALDKGAAFNFHRSVFPMKKDVGVGTSPSKEPILTTTDHPLRMRLLLSARQMVDEGYPFRLPGVQQEKLSDYVFTQELYEEVSGDSPMFSVDCEMVMTTAGKMELARICVIDETLAVVYHSFVKPSNPVTNYLTRFSGITKALLEDVEVTLAEVQAEMRRLLPADAILIGQSLNSDLHAMEMMHPYVIDTSVIYNLTGARGRKTKLSVLSERFLGERIQFMGRSGHDPKEDAIAAM